MLTRLRDVLAINQRSWIEALSLFFQRYVILKCLQSHSGLTL